MCSGEQLQVAAYLLLPVVTSHRGCDGAEGRRRLALHRLVIRGPDGGGGAAAAVMASHDVFHDTRILKSAASSLKSYNLALTKSP